jgi:hypothetical protein
MSDKPFVAEACPPMSHASASNGLSDIKTHIENAPWRKGDPLLQRHLAAEMSNRMLMSLSHYTGCNIVSVFDVRF